MNMDFEKYILRVLSKLSKKEREFVYALAKQDTKEFIRLIQAIGRLEDALETGDRQTVEKIMKEHDHQVTYFMELFERKNLLSRLKDNG